MSSRGSDRDRREKRGCEISFHFLRQAQISFDNLLYFRYVVPWDIEYLTDSWMRMPNLREIELYPSEKTYDPDILPQSRTPIIFPHLQRITVDHIDNDTHPITALTAILSSAPNFSFLHLRGDWDSEKDDAALMAMGNCKFLKTVICQDEDNWAEGDTGISFLNLGRWSMVLEWRRLRLHGKIAKVKN